MLNEFRKLPNQITLFRILLIPILYYLAYNNNRILFLIFLIIIAFTDALDGFLARRLRQESEFGKNLDSIADNIIYISLIPWFYFLEKELLLENVYKIIFLVMLFILSQSINLIKFKRVLFRHTIIAKITAVVLFITIIIAFLTSFNALLFYPVYALAIITILNEIYLSVKNHKSETGSMK